MKTFEISSKKDKNGKRKFKAILYTIFPDACVDEVNQVGTEYQENGITWLREYCEKALPSIEGMSLRCEFMDEARTELHGHGLTDIIDGKPVYENAVVVGTFTKGYIKDIETEDGIKTVCIGEGTIDSQCYHNFVTKLDEDIQKGIYPNGSIEIMKTDDNPTIIYKYGYKEFGRIPMEFIHSGYVFLGITPADSAAKLIELNDKHKEEQDKMDDAKIKAVVAETVAEINSKEAEMETYKAECDAKVAEMNEAVTAMEAEKAEAVTAAETAKTELEGVKTELNAKKEEVASLTEENATLREELGQLKSAQRISEMNEKIANFSDAEKAYAKAEIEAFKADPENVEINSIISKIYEGIGKSAKADAAKKVAEQNSLNDILGDVGYTPKFEDNGDITKFF